MDKKKALEYLLAVASKKNISQACLIDGIYDYSHFNKMCNGKENINLEIIFACASKLNVPVNDLLLAGNYLAPKKLTQIKDEYLECMILQKFQNLKYLLQELAAYEEHSDGVKQLKLNIKGVMEAHQNKSYQKALVLFKDALKCTCKYTNIYDAEFQYFSEDELNIFNNMALCYFSLKDEKYSICYERMIESLRKSSTNSMEILFPKICYNYSVLLLREEKWQQSIKYCNIGIEYSNLHNVFLFLGHLYYNLALVDFKINNFSFIAENLKKAKMIFLLQNKSDYFQQAFLKDFNGFELEF